eukprot:365334-Chlamydomonas_euryale.AAC.6
MAGQPRGPPTLCTPHSPHLCPHRQRMRHQPCVVGGQPRGPQRVGERREEPRRERVGAAADAEQVYRHDDVAHNGDVGAAGTRGVEGVGCGSVEGRAGWPHQ